MTKKTQTLSTWTIILLFLSLTTFAQDNPPEPQAVTANPPPPGLVVSIDKGIPGLLIAGVLVGIYFRKKN